MPLSITTPLSTPSALPTKTAIAATMLLLAACGGDVETTTATGKEMVVLTELTGDMSDYAKQLVDSVNVFKLEA